MPVRYDPLLVAALAREITARWGELRVNALALDPDRRAGELRFEDGSTLLALLHPTAGHLLASEPALPGDGIKFRNLVLSGVEAPPDERSLMVTLSDRGGTPRHRVALELQTNQWNLHFLSPRGEESPEWRIDRALWQRESGGRRLMPGAAYEAPANPRRGASDAVRTDDWTTSLAPVSPEERRATAIREWAYLSTINVDWVLGTAAHTEVAEIGATTEEAAVTEDGAADEVADEVAADEALRAAFERYQELLEGGGTVASEPGAWVLQRRLGPQPYGLALGEASALAAPSLLDAMAMAAEEEGGIKALLAGAGSGERPGGKADEASRLASALAKRTKRLERRRGALERQLEAAGSPDEPRTYGHLLLANKASVARGSSRISLPDFEGEVREIELDPALAAVANAERYFDEARRRERALERIPAEIATTSERLEALREASAALAAEGPSAALWELAGGQPGGRKGRKQGVEEKRLPYLLFRSTGGLEIRVGRGSRDNDALTFHHSSPDDIWLHARQVQGAHVILRWGRKDENPPQRDLSEAAIAAAVHSGARHSGTVAINWTRRKYVRKPRKAPPGSVLADRVKTVFVEPDEALVKRMSAAD
jgi:hypothetical protein